MDLEQRLLAEFGPLLDLGEVAAVLKRKKCGLQHTLDAGQGKFAEGLRGARRKVGRRNLFCAVAIAKLVEQPKAAPPRAAVGIKST